MYAASAHSVVPAAAVPAATAATSSLPAFHRDICTEIFRPLTEHKFEKQEEYDLSKESYKKIRRERSVRAYLTERFQWCFPDNEKNSSAEATPDAKMTTAASDPERLMLFWFDLHTITWLLNISSQTHQEEKKVLTCLFNLASAIVNHANFNGEQLRLLKKVDQVYRFGDWSPTGFENVWGSEYGRQLSDLLDKKLSITTTGKSATSSVKEKNTWLSTMEGRFDTYLKERNSWSGTTNNKTLIVERMKSWLPYCVTPQACRFAFTACVNEIFLDSKQDQGVNLQGCLKYFAANILENIRNSVVKKEIDAHELLLLGRDYLFQLGTPGYERLSHKSEISIEFNRSTTIGGNKLITFDASPQRQSETVACQAHDTKQSPVTATHATLHATLIDMALPVLVRHHYELEWEIMQPESGERHTKLTRVRDRINTFFESDATERINFVIDYCLAERGKSSYYHDFSDAHLKRRIKLLRTFVPLIFDPIFIKERRNLAKAIEPATVGTRREMREMPSSAAAPATAAAAAVPPLPTAGLATMVKPLAALVPTAPATAPTATAAPVPVPTVVPKFFPGGRPS
jgi:hypothetical protein